MDFRKRRSDDLDLPLPHPAQHHKPNDSDDGMTDDERLIFDDQATPCFETSILCPILKSLGYVVKDSRDGNLLYQYAGAELESYLGTLDPQVGKDVLATIGKLSKNRLSHLLRPLHAHTRRYFVNLLVYARLSKKDFQVSTWTHRKWIGTPQLASEIENVLVKNLKLVPEMTETGMVYYVKTLDGTSRLGSLDKIREKLRRKGEDMFGAAEVARLSASRVSTLKVWAARSPTPLCDFQTDASATTAAASVGLSNNRIASPRPAWTLVPAQVPLLNNTITATNQHHLLAAGGSMNGSRLKDPPLASGTTARRVQELLQPGSSFLPNNNNNNNNNSHNSNLLPKIGELQTNTLLTELRKNHKAPSPTTKKIQASINTLKRRYYKQGLLENEVLEAQITQLNDARDEFFGLAPEADFQLSKVRPTKTFVAHDNETPTKDELMALLLSNRQKKEYLDEYKVKFETALETALEKVE
jgi:hypothetical protein